MIWGMGHMGNEYRGYELDGAIGYRGYRGMGNRGIWGNRAQGYGVQDTWAMGTGVVGHMGQ